jgi:hypothetical protein
MLAYLTVRTLAERAGKLILSLPFAMRTSGETSSLSVMRAPSASLAAETSNSTVAGFVSLLMTMTTDERSLTRA